jgi:hypothetical protein
MARLFLEILLGIAHRPGFHNTFSPACRAISPESEEGYGATSVFLAGNVSSSIKRRSFNMAHGNPATDRQAISVTSLEVAEYFENPVYKFLSFAIGDSNTDAILLWHLISAHGDCLYGNEPASISAVRLLEETGLGFVQMTIHRSRSRLTTLGFLHAMPRGLWLINRAVLRLRVGEAYGMWIEKCGASEIQTVQSFLAPLDALPAPKPGSARWKAIHVLPQPASSISLALLPSIPCAVRRANHPSGPRVLGFTYP